MPYTCTLYKANLRERGFCISNLSLSDYVIVALLLMYSKEPLGIKEYGNVLGYLVAMASVVMGTITKEMIVLVMVSVSSLFS